MFFTVSGAPLTEMTNFPLGSDAMVDILFNAEEENDPPCWRRDPIMDLIESSNDSVAR